MMQAKMGDLPQALPELGGSALGGAVLEVEDYATEYVSISIISFESMENQLIIS